MSIPDFCAGPDGFFRFGPQLAEAAAMLVVLEVRKRCGFEPSSTQRTTWAELFNETVCPEYGLPHTAEEMAELESKLHRFIKHTAANELQIRTLKQWRDLRPPS